MSEYLHIAIINNVLILNSKSFEMVLISSNKYFLCAIRINVANLRISHTALYGLIINRPKNGYETIDLTLWNLSIFNYKPAKNIMFLAFCV